MTEDEAKTKWCPFSRHDTTAGNRIPYGKPGDEPAPVDYCAETAMRFPCIGASCMAWRWIPASRSPLFAAAAKKRATDIGYSARPGIDIREVAYRNPPPGVDYDRYDGFCGLAGPARSEERRAGE